MMSAAIRAIVTDIEGTTTALSFVKDVLFPYARERLARFVVQHAHDKPVQVILDDVRKIENNPKLSTEDIVHVLLGWSAADKKITPLKALQGLIWEEGYRTQAYTSHVYPDAVDGLKRWHAVDLPLYIYSSGSIAAQKLLFGYTEMGDLTPLFSGYFDTTIGGKLESASYIAIAHHIAIAPEHILFLSDNVGELDAASTAGFQTILVNRDGLVSSPAHWTVTDFDAIKV